MTPKGFFKTDPSCRFYQSFQIPAEQARQQTCFGYYVLGKASQQLTRSFQQQKNSHND